MATVADKSRIPDVIRFVYDEFSVDQSKKLASAKCRKCRAVILIREKQGTTSAFVRHLAAAAHPLLRKEYVSFTVLVTVN